MAFSKLSRLYLTASKFKSNWTKVEKVVPGLLGFCFIEKEINLRFSDQKQLSNLFFLFNKCFDQCFYRSTVLVAF